MLRKDTKNGEGLRREKKKIEVRKGERAEKKAVIAHYKLSPHQIIKVYL